MEDHQHLRKVARSVVFDGVWLDGTPATEADRRRFAKILESDIDDGGVTDGKR